VEAQQNWENRLKEQLESQTENLGGIHKRRGKRQNKVGGGSHTEAVLKKEGRWEKKKGRPPYRVEKKSWSR